MENAADALKMAAAILIFIIAIASSFSLFGTAKQTADSIIGMRDKQAYLEAAELDTVLYTSSETISKGEVEGFTSNGDRIVGVSDVISTIYRYSKEKYGVTIIQLNGTKGEVIARYDSNTENIMRQWYNIVGGYNSENEYVTAEEQKENYAEKIKDNIYTKYCENPLINLEGIYALTTTGNSKIKCGAPWYGNDAEIQKRINVDLSESDTYTYNGQTYKGKNLFNILNNASKKGKIIEVTNEIDQSKYLSDTNEAGEQIETNLLQQYQMPTVEIIYIVYN